MHQRARRATTVAAAALALGAALACTAGDTDTDTSVDSDPATSGACPLGMVTTRDAAISITQFSVGGLVLSASVDATLTNPTYGPAVCVGETSARLLIYGESDLLAVLTLGGLAPGSFGLAGHATLVYSGAEGTATFADDTWQSGTLDVTDDDPLTFSISNGYAVSNEAFTLILVAQGEIGRP